MNQSLFLINFLKQFSQGYTQAEAIQFAQKCGFTGVELTNMAELTVPDRTNAHHLRSIADSQGLKIVCFSMGIRLECENWKEQVELLKRYIDVANILGTKLFHHTLVPTLGMKQDELPIYSDIVPQLLQATAEIQTYAAKYGITCVYEPQGLVVNGIRNYEDFYNRIPLPNCGIVADLGNIYFSGEKPNYFVSHFLHRITHVHVKDYLVKPGGGQFPGQGWYMNRQGDFLRGTVIGHGCIDFIPIFRNLIRTGYDGWYSLEFDGLEDPFDAARLGKENMCYYYEEAQRQIGRCGKIQIGDF